MSNGNAHSFYNGVQHIAAFTAAINRSTIVNVPFSLCNAYKSIIALGLELNTYSWEQLEHIKSLIFVPRRNDIIDVKNQWSDLWFVGSVTSITFVNTKYKINVTPLSGIDVYPRGNHHFHLKPQFLNDWLAPLGTYTPIHWNQNCYHCYGMQCEICQKSWCLLCAIDKSETWCRKCMYKFEYDNIYQSVSYCVPYFYNEIIKCISDYSIGNVVKCCNNLSCDNEIVFESKWQYVKWKKGQGHYDWLFYEVTDSVELKHNVRSIYGDTLRIFCIDCRESDYLKACVYCINKDCDPFCMNHKDTYNIMYRTISNVLTFITQKQIIQLIADYSIGHVVECSNFEECQTEIFNIAVPFFKSTNYWYPITVPNYDQRYHLTKLDSDTLCRIFCVSCQKHLQFCKRINCLNEDVECNCVNHNYCIQCDNYKFTKCSGCKQLFCVECSLVEVENSKRFMTVYFPNNMYYRKWKVLCKDCLIHMNYSLMYQQILRAISCQKTMPHVKAIIHCITSYSIGIVINCSNNECNNEIAAKNKLYFNKNIDINGEIFYKYQTKTKILFTEVYGKQYRIFCAECTKYRLNKCIDPNCNIEDCRKYCLSDVFCIICNKHPTKTNKRKRMVNCKICQLLVCTKCVLDNECASCVIRREQQIIFKTIKQSNIIIKNHAIIKFITQYSIGHIIKCSNNNCETSIIIDNKFQLYNLDSITHYIVDKAYITDKNQHQFVYLYDEFRRIGCRECSHDCISCGNTCFIENMTCFNHPNCYFCNIETINSCQKCKLCKKYYCNHCGVFKKHLCKVCENHIISTTLKQSIYFAVGDFLTMDIVEIIVSYAKGYLLKCCNLKASCSAVININNLTEFENNIDMDGNDIFQYTIRPQCISDKEKRKVHFVFGKYRIYFCSDCVSSETLHSCYNCANLRVRGDDNLHMRTRYCYNHISCDNCGRTENAWRNVSKCCHYCNKYICEWCAEFEDYYGVWKPSCFRQCQYLLGTYDHILEPFSNNAQLTE
eukprot:480807_1